MAAAATRGAGASASMATRVLVLGLLASLLFAQAEADSTITNLSTKGNIFVFDKLLPSGKAVTVVPAQQSSVKLSREQNGPYGLVPLKDRRRYFIVDNGDTSFPSDLVEGSFITSAF